MPIAQKLQRETDVNEDLAKSLQRIEALLSAGLGLGLSHQRIALDIDDYEAVEGRTIRLLHAGGFSQGRIAEVLGVSQPTVSRRLRNDR